MRGDAVEPTALTDFQVEVARLFFALPAATPFLLVGGAALVAAQLTTRPTQDLDFFTQPSVGSVTLARDEFEAAVQGRGWTVERIRDSETFCRLVVHGPEDLVVDLAVDSPPTGPPMRTFVGPTLDPVDLAGRKLLALFGRAEARDFADVFVLAQRFGTQVLWEQGQLVDAGLDAQVLVAMIGSLDRFADDEIPIEPDAVQTLREFYERWRSELTGG